MACNHALRYAFMAHSEFPDRMSVLTIAFPCGKSASMDIDLPIGGLRVCFDLWQRGLLIQEAFPMLTDDEREFILTGLTPEEWEEMHQEFDEDDGEN